MVVPRPSDGPWIINPLLTLKEIARIHRHNMSLKSGTLPKPGGAFDRKPKNHGVRYNHVACLTDTGKSASKVGPSISNSQLARRRDETFKRVRMHTLAQKLRDRAPPESVYALGGDYEIAGCSAQSVVESEMGAVVGVMCDGCCGRTCCSDGTKCNGTIGNETRTLQ